LKEAQELKKEGPPLGQRKRGKNERMKGKIIIIIIIKNKIYEK
jgi:hypothetical protein